MSERDVPFVFVTGYDETAVPERFRAVPRCEKPVEPEEVTRTLGHVLAD